MIKIYFGSTARSRRLLRTASRLVRDTEVMAKPCADRSGLRPSGPAAPVKVVLRMLTVWIMLPSVACGLRPHRVLVRAVGT